MLVPRRAKKTLFFGWRWLGRSAATKVRWKSPNSFRAWKGLASKFPVVAMSHKMTKWPYKDQAPASLVQHISLFLPLSILMVADVRGSQDETISLRMDWSAWMVWSARRNNLSTSWLSITIISSTITVLIIVVLRDHHQKHQSQHHWGTIGFSHVLILSQMTLRGRVRNHSDFCEATM